MAVFTELLTGVELTKCSILIKLVITIDYWSISLPDINSLQSFSRKILANQLFIDTFTAPTWNWSERFMEKLTLPLLKNICLREGIMLSNIHPTLACSNRKTLVRCDPNFKESTLVKSVDFGNPLLHWIGKTVSRKQVHCWWKQAETCHIEHRALWNFYNVSVVFVIRCDAHFGVEFTLELNVYTWWYCGIVRMGSCAR